MVGGAWINELDLAWMYFIDWLPLIQLREAPAALPPPAEGGGADTRTRSRTRGAPIPVEGAVELSQQLK